MEDLGERFLEQLSNPGWLVHKEANFMTFSDIVMIICHETKFLHMLLTELGLASQQMSQVAAKQNWQTGYAIRMTEKRSLSLLLPEFQIVASLVIRIADPSKSITREHEIAQLNYLQVLEMKKLGRLAIFLDWIKEVMSPKVNKKLFNQNFSHYLE